MIALDTETTGVDFYHGARPFLVTTCNEDGENRWWGPETGWKIDPLTRKVTIPPADIRDIRQVIKDAWGWGTFAEDVRERHTLVLQNAKFDITALTAAGVLGDGLEWPWHMTRDTLLAGHLLASNQPHNLTDMAYHYLGNVAVDMERLEKATEVAVKEARRVIQQARLRHKRGAEDNNPLAHWRIAEAGLPDMPSAKETTWKYDLWLPGALLDYWLELGTEEAEALAQEHKGWADATEAYANADSAVTLSLWKVQREQLLERDLWNIYLVRVKAAAVAPRMESRGVTVNRVRLENTVTKLTDEVEVQRCRLVNIARTYDYDLTLPKSGNNNKSLKQFCFGQPIEDDGAEKGANGKGKKPKPNPLFPPLLKQYLDLPIVARTEAGFPSLNAKEAIPIYLLTLDPKGRQYQFVKALAAKAKRETSVGFLEGYRRFWQPMNGENGAGLDGWCLLHPQINPTGTDTLRWSHSNPNSGNISKQESECPACEGEGCEKCDDTGYEILSVRRCFGPREGREWYSMDAKNIELRIPAYKSGEPALIALFEKPDEPPFYGSQHLLNFSVVYPDVWADAVGKVGLDKAGPWCKKTYASTYYQWDKNGDFAIQYNCGEATADRTFRRKGAFRALKHRFNKLEGLNQAKIRFAEKHGYIETEPDRSVDPKRGYPLLCTRTEWGKILSTIPLSYYTQGTAMWWTMMAMIRVQEQLDEWNKPVWTDACKKYDTTAGREYYFAMHGYFLILQVHDELVFDFPRYGDPALENERVKKEGRKATDRTSNLWRVRRLQELMTVGGDHIGIPTPVGVEYHTDSWGEGVTL